ncbi:MAG: aminotransferase class V-fold PLP-dependent enzyme [Pseudobdellovibrionaceae bacterium]
MLHDFSKDFQYKDLSFVNVNNGTLGLCPKQVIDQQKFELECFEKNTTRALDGSWVRLWSIQEELGKFFNASPKDIFLRPNVTLALNEIIMSLHVPKGGEILSTNWEYGAVVNILKYKAQKDNLALRLGDVSFLLQDISSEQAVESLLALTNENTKVFLISHIFTGTGIEAPLKPLAKKLRERGILLVVDGAHAPGLIELDFQSELNNVDFYAGNLHKWMMGPKGTAFGWVHPLHQENTYPMYGSWTTSDNASSATSVFKNHSAFAERMLWCHSQNFSSYFSLEACLKFWNHHGKDKIIGEVRNRMVYLQDELSKTGLHPLKKLNSNLGVRFLCYHLNEISSENFFEDLYIRNSSPKVQVGRPRVPGFPVLRLTPHIHNSLKELDHVVQAIGNHKQIHS